MAVQAWILKRQAKILGQQDQRLKQQADILAQALEMSRNDQRAWVGALGGVSLSEIREGIAPAGNATIKNSGKTPALHVETHVICRLQPQTEEFEAFYPPPEAQEPPRSRMVLQPQTEQQLPFRAASALTKEDIDDIISRTKILYIYGKVSYADVFRQCHCSTFAYRIRLFKTEEGKLTALGYILDTYNEAD
jgi:hypothetical protein